jgi:hypothetical protein
MNKSQIISELRQIQIELSDYVESLTPEAFEAAQGESWSASGYLKHLILSNKPFVKGLNLPKGKLAEMFGQTENGSRSYDEMVAVYKGRLAEGIRAENYDKVTPDFYRLPDEVTDEKAYFVETWNDTHEKLYLALDSWEESDLDRYLIPHPAMGTITIREMLYFTIAHNRLHCKDIKALAIA